MTVHNATSGTANAKMGMTDIRFPVPGFAGDMLRAVTTMVAVRV